MRTFSELRKKGMPAGEHVFDTKIGKNHLMVHKEKGKFVTYIDMEKLDTYPSLGMAKKAGAEFIKVSKK
jgi:hypothetical protein